MCPRNSEGKAAQMHLTRYMPRDHPINFAWCCERGREKYYKVIPLTCNMGFMEKVTVHSSSLDQRDQQDGEVTQTSIYNYHKEGTRNKILLWHSGVKDLPCLLAICCPRKMTQTKNIFSRFCSRLCWGAKMTQHPSHCQPFSDDEMFHASLSTDCKIEVTLCPPELREMIVALQAKLPQSIEWMCQWCIPH